MDQNLNGNNYLAMLQNNVVATLVNLYPDLATLQVSPNTIKCQEDRALPHYIIKIRQYLNLILYLNLVFPKPVGFLMYYHEFRQSDDFLS